MTRIKKGIPSLREIKEGETENRYVENQGLISYTRYNNRLFSSKLHSSVIPPAIDVDAMSKINNNISVAISSASSGSSEIDYDSIPDAAIADGDYIIFLDTSSSNQVKKEALNDLSTQLAGLVTSSGLASATSRLKIDIQNMTASTSISDSDLIVVDDGANGTLRKMTRANFIESAALDAINIDGGAIDGTPIGANSHTTIKGTTIDATTDFTIGSTVITDDQIQMTPSLGDTVTISAGSGGTLNITTVDAAASAGHINITADGTFDIVSSGLFKVDSNNGITLDANSGVISFLDNATHGLTFTNSSGDWEIDNATADKSIDIHVDSRTLIKLDGSTGGVHINGYAESLNLDYKFHIKHDGNIYTQGEGDYKQNYSMVSREYSSSSFNTSYGT